MARSNMVRIAIVFLLGLFCTSARAEKRIALVIGNSAYENTGRLANPKNDAADISAALKKLGFSVIEGFDLKKFSFDRKVRDFAAALQGAEVGLFFFAGHGLQVAGQNYLVPVDAELTTAAALDFEMVRVDVVHRIMEQQTNTNILFLDACRDNPLARNLARAMGTRSAEISRGFAPVASGVGTFISFSTQPGNVALDGTGRNSPFAGALVRHISASTDDLSRILIHVRNDVGKDTQGKQVPWDHSALTAPFYFNGSMQTAPLTTQAPARLSEAAEAWDRTKDSTNIAVLEAFIARFTDTFFADLARSRLAELRSQQATVSVPPQTPKAVTPSPTPRPPLPSDSFNGWTLLGEQSVGFRVDRDVIKFAQTEDWYKDRAFRRIHIVVEGNDIHLIAVRLVYFNNNGEDYRVDRLIRESEIQAIDLRGDKSLVQALEVNYRSRPGFQGRAVIKVYGEPSKLERPMPVISTPTPPSGAVWAEIGCKNIALFGKDRDSLEVRLADAHLKQIRLHLRGADVEMLDLRVIYANGQPDDIPVRRVIRQGDRTQPLDLRGRGRSIHRVEMVYRTIPNFKGLARVCVEGLQ